MAKYARKWICHCPVDDLHQNALSAVDSWFIRVYSVFEEPFCVIEIYSSNQIHNSHLCLARHLHTMDYGTMVTFGPRHLILIQGCGVM